MKRLAVFALILAACAPARGPDAPVSVEPTPVNASFGRTWDTVIDLFAEDNIAISTLDRASGFIVAERALATKADSAFADCGFAIMNQRFTPGSAKYNIVVRGDSGKSTVRTNVRWTESPSGAYPCHTTGKWERMVQERIKTRAESR